MLGYGARLGRATYNGGRRAWQPAVLFTSPTATLNDRSWQILLQKSKVAELRIFRENTKREAIADSYNLIRVTEVAYEFDTRR
jgi:hypothetical protein